MRPPGLLVGLLRTATGYATRRSLSGGAGHEGPSTGHFDGTVFRNEDPGASAGKGLEDFLRWQRTRQSVPWPRWRENTAVPQLPSRLESGECAVTFVNHITFLLQFAGLNVLTDPVWSERVSPVSWAGPKRVRSPGLAFDALPRIDLVLVSHSHYDHLDLDTLQRLERAHRPLVVTCLGNRTFLEEHGLARVIELDWWQDTPLPNGRLLCTPAQHWSGRGFSGRNRTLWGGFLIETGGRKIYFSGDTGYCAQFVEVRRRCGEVDIALLPIGAYEPRWFMRDQHMNPDEAVRAHLDLGARLSIATHFGCFRLTDEGIDDPVRDLELALQAHGVEPGRFRALETGETLRLPR
jgi:L-ascorbate metabolism protein UlaG (beta-lactamase superfamily)